MRPHFLIPLICLSTVAAVLMWKFNSGPQLESKTSQAADSDPGAETLIVQFAELEARLRAVETQLATSKTTANNAIALESGVIDTQADEANNAAEVLELAEQSQRSNSSNQPGLSADEVHLQRLISGGFTSDEADWIFAQEQALELEALMAQHEYQRALRNGTEAQHPGPRRQFIFDQLREQLGDDHYQRYLESQGFPTEVHVGRIIPGSAAGQAGLLPGDRILGYAGKKIFSMRELTELTLQGEVGESVLVEVERDSTPIQVTVPRGPIGIVGGRP